jgi:hypothetical protein
MMDKIPENRPSLDEIDHVFTHILEFLATRPPEGEKEVLADESFKKVKKELDVLSKTTPAIAAVVAKKEIPRKRTMQIMKTLAKFGFAKSIASALLLLALSSLTGLLIYNRFVDDREESPAGALSAVTCIKCKKAYEIRVMDIKTTKCIHCEGALAYRQKCNICKFEFPYKIPDASTENFKIAAMAETDDINKCPKCNSSDTDPAPTSLEKKQFRSR